MESNHPYFPRFQGQRLAELFQYFPIVVILGARQVGKSTLMEHDFPSLPRIVFDPIIDVENGRKDPDLFLENRRPPLILDEIQYVPELIPAIKRRLEKDRRPGQYLITGSQQWGVMKLLAESLAGRAAFLDLEGFCLGEIAEIGAEGLWLESWLQKEELKDFTRIPLKHSLFEQLWRGFLPEAQFLPKNLIPTFYESYQRTYIERDIRQLAEVSDLQLFSRFFRLCAALTGQEVNASHFGREMGISPQTASRWLNLLKTTFQWFEIPAYSGNTVKRISLSPKGYLSDTGLIAWSQAISSPETIPAHPLWGSLFETAVVQEIRKQCSFLPTPPKLFHWRTHGGAEVDLLLEYNGKFFPIEIKGSSHPSGSAISGIQALRKTYPQLSIARGLVIAPTESTYPLSPNDFVIPWDSRSSAN